MWRRRSMCSVSSMSRSRSGVPNRHVMASAPLRAILVVDDEPKLRAAVRDALRGEAEQVLEAPSAKAAIATAEAERPDVIILDLGLPDQDGIEVCRAIRAWSSAPIIV